MRLVVTMRSAAAALLGLGLLAISSLPSQAYTAFYVFGDSLSDTGNVYLETGGTFPPPPYAPGRFTNGPNWVDDLAAIRHLGPVTPFVAGGNNFAFGGATTADTDLTVPGNVPGINQQVGLFQARVGQTAPSDALYAVWIGANDVLNTLAAVAAGTVPKDDAPGLIAADVRSEVAALATLATAGARDFLIGLVPDLGRTPRLNTDANTSRAASTLAGLYNTMLKGALTTTLRGDHVTYLDAFTLLDNAVDHPAAYGFSNVTDACYSPDLTANGTECGSPDDFLFWDSIHPTAAGHAAVAALADRALNAVPLPGTLPLAGAGLLVLAVCRRRSCRASSTAS